MERYLGMDVHAASCTFSVKDAAGKWIHRNVVVETNGRALIGYLKQQPGRLHLGLEESEWAHWLHEILSPHVAELVVMRAERSTGSKSDAIDADGLAERMRTGRVGQPVFKAQRYAKLRELARVYRAMTADVTRTKNRLKSCYRRRGVACRGTAIYNPKTRDARIRALPAAQRPAVRLLGQELDGLEQLKADSEAAMVKESHRFRISRILETTPGIGEIRVALLLPIVVTPHRFRTKRQFWSYCGFGIVRRTSSDWVQVKNGWVKAPVAQTRGLNLNHNHVLKDIFKGAATTTICGKDNRFRGAYDRLLEQGTKPNLAKLTVARKIAAAVLTMWKNQEVFDPKR